MLFFRSHQAM